MKRFLKAACRGIAPFLAVAMFWFAAAAVKLCLNMPPAESYRDEGVHTFTAVSGYPTTRRGYWQKKYHRYSTRRVYVVEYRAPSGWRWQVDFLTETQGKEAVQNREQVERRVLSLVEESSYVTVSPELTPQGYVEQQRHLYLTISAVCVTVLAAEGAVYLLLKKKRKSP